MVAKKRKPLEAPTIPKLIELQKQLVGYWRETLVEDFVRIEFLADEEEEEERGAKYPSKRPKSKKKQEADFQKLLELTKKHIYDVIIHFQENGVMRYCVISDDEENQIGDWTVDEKNSIPRLITRCGGKRVVELENLKQTTVDWVIRGKNRKITNKLRMKRLRKIPNWADLNVIRD